MDTYPSRASPSKPVKATLRNPILHQNVEPEPLFRSSVKEVPTHLSSGTQSPVTFRQERPRGRGKGTFAIKNNGSYTVGFDPEDRFRPMKRMGNCEKTGKTTSPKVRKRAEFSPTKGNPITQEHIAIDVPKSRLSTTVTWSPSTETQFLSSRREFLPSETLTSRRKSVQPPSTIFLEGADSTVVRSRLTLERPSQAGAILQYKFAGRYRDEDIALKPSAKLLKSEDFRELKVRRNQAELYRVRQSTGQY